MLFQFLVGIKTSEISAYTVSNCIFTKNLNNFEILRQIFSYTNFRKLASELSSFMSASSKSIMTTQLAAQNAGRISP